MKQRWMSLSVAFGLIAVPSNHAIAAIIANGDFSGGNTGFNSGYTYEASDPPNVGGHYSVDVNPLNFNSGMASFGDHTTGTGPMMIVDGSTTSGVTVWQEVVSVTPNTVYQWTAFAAAAGEKNGDGTDQSPAKVVFSANAAQVGTTLDLPAMDGQWVEFSGTFNSGSSTTEVLGIVDTNTAFLGNDFVLDDISLTPEPSSLTMIGTIGGLSILLRRTRCRKPTAATDD